MIGYYGNSILCYIVIILALIPAYIYTAGALIGEIYAAIYYGKEYSIACGVLLWVYIIFLICLVFWGSTGRKALERETLAARRKEQEEEHAQLLKRVQDAENQANTTKKVNENEKL